MSAYGKAQPPQLHTFDTTRAFTESTFAYAAPPFVTHPPVSSAPTQSFSNATHMSQIAYASQNERNHYDPQSGPYLNIGAPSIPQVTSYQPQRGPSGARFLVYISSLYELTTSSLTTFALMFGARKCGAALTKLDGQGGVCQYVVATDTPTFSTTQWSNSQVPVFLIMESSDGEPVCKVNVGNFDYNDGGVQLESRQRRMSDDSVEIKSPSKRPSANQLRPKEEFTAHGYSFADTPQFYPNMHTHNPYSMISQQPSYSRPNSGFQGQNAQRHMYYPNSAPTSPPMLHADSPTWAGYPQKASQRASPSNIGQGPSSRPSLSALSSASTSSNPVFIRTSMLQQIPSPGITPGHQPSYSAYNAYNYPKAQLQINGSLESMTDHWTNDEWECGRRIVHFKRSQSGPKIIATARPVTLDKIPNNSICISCIWWKEKEDWYMTSVDGIFLLEALLFWPRKFPVEEKNRIRRNLEGFHPQTMNKNRKGCEDFFKLIMGFPNPKPRNIEKDIKVFPWKILSNALKKIISKFSAVPLAIAHPSLLTPSSSTGYAVESNALAQNHSQAHLQQQQSDHSHPRPLSYQYPAPSSRPLSPALMKTVPNNNLNNPYGGPPAYSLIQSHSHSHDDLRLGQYEHIDSGLNSAHHHEINSNNYSNQSYTPTTSVSVYGQGQLNSAPHRARQSIDWNAGVGGSGGGHGTSGATNAHNTEGGGGGKHLESTSGNVNAGVNADFNSHGLGLGLGHADALGERGLGDDETPVGVSVPKLLDPEHITGLGGLSSL